MVLLVLLNEDGSTHSVRGETTSGDPAIGAAAEFAAKNWKYLPAMLGGKPARSVLRMHLHYGKNTPEGFR
ncbi:hypothetical protein GLA29479_372 [Lysobacter antibioticus]|nr:hypothetical protein GLA29479_372 [Lysobacter antibioticus]